MVMPVVVMKMMRTALVLMMIVLAMMMLMRMLMAVTCCDLVSCVEVHTVSEHSVSAAGVCSANTSCHLLQLASSLLLHGEVRCPAKNALVLLCGQLLLRMDFIDLFHGSHCRHP